ncbi:MAG: phenol hydroxylase subunit P4 [Gammaproteobacteria bacterium]
MPVKSIGEYSFPAMDSMDKYHGNQLIYIGWDHHTMVDAPMGFPVPPDMPFGGIIENLIPAAYDQHPDFPLINWDEVIWIMDGENFTPDMNLSIKDNGVIHKGAVRFKTPGLNGIKGSGS